MPSCNKSCTRDILLLIVGAAIAVLPTDAAVGGKGGKGGGGGGSEQTTAFSVIELPGFARAHSVSNPDPVGVVTVAGETGEGGFVAATYALVDTTTRQAITGLLPEPTDNAPVDSASFARDANAAGVIVGGADVYDEAVQGNRRSVAVRWVPSSEGYVYQILPLLEGDSYGAVSAVNEAGEMVGVSQTFNSGRAAYWSADGASVVSLNDLLPDDSGWILLTADDINAHRQVLGTGLLDATKRGFIFDLQTLSITAVPLVAGAVENEARQINDAGHVVGKANDGVVGGGPFPQGGWGYFWAGPGSQPQLLPSLTGGAAIVRAINNQSVLAGDSQFDGEAFMSLWRPNEDGGFTVSDVGTQIPSKPVWDLSFGFDLNDDGWLAGEGRKFTKGKYSWHGVLVVPNL